MSKSLPIKTNLLQQNCFVRDCTFGRDLKSSSALSTYLSVDEHTDSTGLRINYNEYPYPITPQYVNSFVDSSDYHRDPTNAVANGVKRVNLNDVSSIQSLSKLDSSAQRALYEQLRSKFSSLKTEPDNVVHPDSNPDNDDGGNK